MVPEPPADAEKVPKPPSDEEDHSPVTLS